MGYFKKEAQIILLLTVLPIIVMIILSLFIRDSAKVVVAFLITLTLLFSIILYHTLRHK